MAGAYRVGTRYEVGPIPADPAATTYVDAGAVRFGVEGRVFNDAAIVAAHQHDGSLEEILALKAARGVGSIDDGGISIHVFDAATGAEHLRFDCFRAEPHYHYIDRPANTVVTWDAALFGEMLPAVLALLRTRLPALLRSAGRDDLAARIDRVAVIDALDEVERLVAAASAES